MDKKNSSFFDFSTPFVEYCTDTTIAVFLKYIHKCAGAYQLTPRQAVLKLLEAPIDEFEQTFKQEVALFARECCAEYLADLTSNSFTEFIPKITNYDIYKRFQEIIKHSKMTNSGYRHLNCIFDGGFNYCLLQFKYVFQYLCANGFMMAGTHSSHDGNFSVAELRVLRQCLKMIMETGNKEIMDQIRSNTTSLECTADNICERDVNNELQRLNEISTQLDACNPDINVHCTCGRRSFMNI